jgi:hypothetical protein
MIRTDQLRLPRVDEPPPNLALMVLGKALAQAYAEPVDQPLPSTLARIVDEIERREALGPRPAGSGALSTPTR